MAAERARTGAGADLSLGRLHLSPRNAPHNAALFDAVKPDGFIDGQNLVVDDHGFRLRVSELADHASAIVKANVDLIVCAGDPPVRAAQQATKTIPILALAPDMVRSGFVACSPSLAVIRRASASSPPSLTASGRKSSWKQCPEFAAWRRSPTPTAPCRNSSKRCRKRRAPAASICPSTGGKSR